MHHFCFLFPFRLLRWIKTPSLPGCTGMPAAESYKVCLWRRTKVSITSLYPSQTTQSPLLQKCFPSRYILKIIWTQIRPS